MTPKEKADYLVEEFLYIENEYKEHLDFKQAKECALIAVNEIIKSSPARSPGTDSSDFMPHFKAVIFWEEVKQEILKL
jgi:hypothetical protein